MPCATLTVQSAPAPPPPSPPPSPNIALRNAWLNKNSIAQGESVVVYAEFYNSGGASGTVTWSASVDGVSNSKSLTVPANSVVTDNLSLIPNKSGTLTVTVSGAGSTRSLSLTVTAPAPTYYTVTWGAISGSGWETLDAIPGTQTVQAGGSASGKIRWTATVTGTETIQLYYDGAYHTVGSVYVTKGNVVEFTVGVGNVQKNMNIGVGVKKP
jgi:hypothetical protein